MRRSSSSGVPATYGPTAVLVLWALLLGSPASAFNAGLGEPSRSLDRSSPLATVKGFVGQVHSGQLDVAAQYLLLDDVPAPEQHTEGERIARRLRLVLDQHPLDLSALPKEGEGGADSLVLSVLDLEGKPLAIRLVRLRTDEGVVWLFGRDTVRTLDQLDASYDPPFGKRIPQFLFRMRLGLELWQWLGILLGFAAAFLVGWLGDRLLLALLGRLTRLSRVKWDDELIRALRGPLTIFLGIVGFQVVEARLLLSPSWETGVGLACRSLGIFAATWFAIRAVNVAEEAINRTLAARGTVASAGTRTQMAMLWRIVSGVIVLVALAILLMQFNVVRKVGVSLLASAGVAGIVLGLAAQKSIGALIAGIQLSVSQPIRIGDQVVVENESGVVDKISLTSVVLRLWDNRFLILPVTYFLEKPFQNWTRENVDIVGTVLLHLDYRVDVQALRTELDRILAGPGKALWNRRVGVVQVTDASEQTITIRILVSTQVSSVMELRCLVREEMLKFLRDHPEWLPMERQEHRPGEQS